LPPVLKIFKVLDHILHEYSNFKCLYQSKWSCLLFEFGRYSRIVSCFSAVQMHWAMILLEDAIWPLIVIDTALNCWWRRSCPCWC
jgi:hypothetical protein